MAGGLIKYRHLSRTSAHRQALLRNLVTSLIKHESVHTTWHKAKEAQRLAEKLITYAKRDNEERPDEKHTPFFMWVGEEDREKREKRGLDLTIQTPDQLMPKLFGKLKNRYQDRPGGYTRVLRTEAKKDDQAESAVLELVDGRCDLRFALTAATVARDRDLGRTHTELTQRNWDKVTRFRPNGKNAFESMVEQTRKLNLASAGTQITDIDPVVFNRDSQFNHRKIKPVHDYWQPPPKSQDASSSSNNNNNNSGKNQNKKKKKAGLSEIIGDPSLPPSERAKP